VQAGEIGAERRAMRRRWSLDAHAFKERDDDGRPARELAERHAVARLDRQRTIDAVGRQMLHQPQEKR
jgi:hypothetical protein